MIIQDVVFSIGQEIILNTVKGIYKDRTISNTLEKQFKKAVLGSVKTVLPYAKYDDIVDAIARDIINYIVTQKDDIDNIDLANIVNKTLIDYNEYNIDSKLISKGIVAQLPIQIFGQPDLNVLVNTNNIFDLLSKNKQILSELSLIRNDMEIMREEVQLLRQLMMELMNINGRFALNRIKMEKNKKFIPDKYIEYFENPLFLEESLKDDLVVRLKDIYILPKYSILDVKLNIERFIRDDIKDFISEFANDRKVNEHTIFKDITTMFIKGQPGSGKSSLFYYLAYSKGNNSEFLPNHKMYFIKLIELYKDNGNKLTENNPLNEISNYIEGENIDFNNTIIVLDGLDEICAVKEINIYEYCNNLISDTFNFNNLKIIITTRSNYINIPNLENKNVINIQINNWSIEQLFEWKEKYFNIHKDKQDLNNIAQDNLQFLSEDRNKEMLDILALPLIFYMITAIGLNVCDFKSIGQLYDKVFEELYNRNYNQNVNSALQRCGIIRKIPQNVSRQIAMEIAYEMYKKNGETLLKIDSKELGGVINSAISVNEQVEVDALYKEQVEKLFPITFFYKDTYDVVEFAHKSIMEFFCAEKIYYNFINSDEKITEFINKNMIQIPITTEIMQFFCYFYETRQFKENNYREKIIEEFRKIIILGNEVETTNKLAYGYELSKLKFKIFWIFIKEILKCNSDDINKLLSDKYMMDYLLGILRIRDSKNLAFINSNIFSWNFENCYFPNYDFEYVDLRYANFKNSQFCECKFANADLQYCKFVAVKINKFTEFSFSNLCNCELSKISNSGNVFLNYVKVGKTIISNCDVRRWVFYNIIYMDSLVFIDVKINSNQFKELVMNKNVYFKNSQIIISTEIIKDKNISNLKKIFGKNKEKNKSEIIKQYVDTIIDNWIESIKYSSDLSSCEIIKKRDEIIFYINKKLNY